MNDFAFGERAYREHKTKKSWKRLDPRSDAVNPSHHPRLLDPEYQKSLEGLQRGSGKKR